MPVISQQNKLMTGWMQVRAPRHLSWVRFQVWSKCDYEQQGLEGTLFNQGYDTIHRTSDVIGSLFQVFVHICMYVYTHNQSV